MRAAVLRRGALVVEDVPPPAPGPGEVLVRTLACGICGSDLHAVRHGDRMMDVSRRIEGALAVDLAGDVVMGHEFCAEVVEHGPDTARTLRPGTVVCSPPLLLRPERPCLIGYSRETPGGYAEYMRLTEMLLFEVPNALPPRHAALTEPMAVGVHAVEMARLDRNDVPLVIGCGPVGLAVIAALRLRDARPIVAADFSPRRRELAGALGADVVVDPAEQSPYRRWQDVALWTGDDAPPALPWLPGSVRRPAVIFECVGVPGVIEQIVAAAPPRARIVVVGVCMEPDRFEPMLAVNKELNVQFVLAYTPEEFARTLYDIAEGRIPVEALVTGTVGIDGVPGAFEDLASPERHAKIVVEP